MITEAYLLADACGLIDAGQALPWQARDTLTMFTLGSLERIEAYWVLEAWKHHFMNMQTAHAAELFDRAICFVARYKNP